MNTQSRNRSSVTPSDPSETQLLSCGRQTNCLKFLTSFLNVGAPLCFNPLFLLLFFFFSFFFAPVQSSCRLSGSFSLRSVLFLHFSNFDFPLVLDSAAPALPLSLAHCLCQMSWLLFFFFLPHTLPPSLSHIVSLSLPLSLQNSCRDLSLLFFVLHHLLEIDLSLSLSLFYPQSRVSEEFYCVLCVWGESDDNWVTRPEYLCVC